MGSSACRRMARTYSIDSRVGLAPGRANSSSGGCVKTGIPVYVYVPSHIRYPSTRRVARLGAWKRWMQSLLHPGPSPAGAIRSTRHWRSAGAGPHPPIRPSSRSGHTVATRGLAPRARPGGHDGPTPRGAFAVASEREIARVSRGRREGRPAPSREWLGREGSSRFDQHPTELRNSDVRMRGGAPHVRY
jgi:hypothetical protein